VDVVHFGSDGDFVVVVVVVNNVGNLNFAVDATPDKSSLKEEMIGLKDGLAQRTGIVIMNLIYGEKCIGD